MFTLDKDKATAADKQASSRIEEKGEYVGVFTEAEYLTAKSGTNGIRFKFIDDGGAIANTTLWLVKSNGEELSGMNTLQGIMTCLKLKHVADPVSGTVDKYNKDTKKTDKVSAQIFPDFLGKKIGLLIYIERGFFNGKPTIKPHISAPFDADTRFTASEILTRATTPKRLSEMANRLRDKVESGAPSAPVSQQNGFDQPAKAAVDFDDDIPF